MLKSALILFCLALGLFLPFLSDYSFTIRPFLMTLLFFSFLEVKLSKKIFHRYQAYVALLLPFVGLLAYFAGTFYDERLAVMLLLMGIAPTAVITPVLAGIMRKNVGYMVGAILFTHASMAVSVPLLLPMILDFSPTLADLGLLFANIAGTVFVPLLLAEVVKLAGPRVLGPLKKAGPYFFVLFLSNITVAAASLSYYVRNEAEIGLIFIGVTAAAMAVLMLVSFGIGSRMAPAGHGVEGSLALGRKNTMLSIWIALEFINPLIVLGPMLYILLQNVLVSGQIVWVERRAD